MMVHPRTFQEHLASMKLSRIRSAQGSPRLALRDWKAFSVTDFLTHEVLESVSQQLGKRAHICSLHLVRNTGQLHHRAPSF